MFSPTLDSLDNLCTMYFTFCSLQEFYRAGIAPPDSEIPGSVTVYPQLWCAWSIGSIYMYLWIDLIERLYLYNESSLGVLFPKLIHTQIMMKLLDNVDVSHCEN